MTYSLGSGCEGGVLCCGASGEGVGVASEGVEGVEEEEEGEEEGCEGEGEVGSSRRVRVEEKSSGLSLERCTSL